MSPEQTKILALKRHITALKQKIEKLERLRQIKKPLSKVIDSAYWADDGPRTTAMAEGEYRAEVLRWAPAQSYPIGYTFRFVHRDYITRTWTRVPTPEMFTIRDF